MAIHLLSKKFFLNLLNKCSARRLLAAIIILFVGGLIAYQSCIRVHESTYYWQVTELASAIRPIKRTSCDWQPHNNQSKPPMQSDTPLKIGIASIYADDDNTWNDKLMERTLQNRIDYCNRHNYKFINANFQIDHTRPVAWSKLLLYKILPEYDYLVYIDMDVVIMDMNRSIEEFILGAAQNSDFIMTQDWSGPNTGVWIVRNSPFSLWFLETAFNQKQLLSPRSTNGYKYPFEYEQRAFHYLLNTKLWRNRHLPLYTGDKYEEIPLHFHYYKQCSFNSYIVHPFEVRASRQVSQYIKGDFLVHFAGKKGKIKNNLIEIYLNMAESGIGKKDNNSI